MDPSSLAFDSFGYGPPLVLLHAFPFDRRMWRPQRDGLAEVCRVLAVDLPGFGGSPLPAGGWTVDAAADLLAGWLDGLGPTEPVALCGLSMGGYVALAFARRHPSRLRALVLADTRAEPDSHTAKIGRAATLALLYSGGAAAVVEDALPKQLREATRTGRPEVAAEVRWLGASQSAEGIAAAVAALRDRPDARPGLRDVAVPTLVLVGADDSITPPAAARVLADGIPGARLEVLPGAGHLSNLEAPDAFNAAVRAFLAGRA